MTKQLVGFGAAVMTTLLAIVLLWQFQIVVVYMLISLTLASAVRPLVRRVVGRGFVMRAAWILLYLIALGIVGFLLFVIGETVINEIPLFIQAVSAQDEWRLSIWLQGSWLNMSWSRACRRRVSLPFFQAVAESQGQLVLPTIFGFTQGIVEVVSGALLILLLSIYWSISQNHFERFWLSLFPSGQRKQVRGIWRTLEHDIGAYIRSQVFQSILAGLLLGIGYWLFGSPYPMLLALAGALAYLIPVVGVVLAVILPLFVGLLIGVQHSLVLVLYTLVVLISLAVWVNPRLFRQRWDNSILTVVLLIALADAFGLVGIIVAPLLSVVCQILWSRLVSHRLASETAAQVSDLKERQERLRAAIQEMDEPPPPLVTNSMERLTQLIVKAEPILQAALPAESSERLPHVAPSARPGSVQGVWRTCEE